MKFLVFVLIFVSFGFCLPNSICNYSIPRFWMNHVFTDMNIQVDSTLESVDNFASLKNRIRYTTDSVLMDMNFVHEFGEDDYEEKVWNNSNGVYISTTNNDGSDTIKYSGDYIERWGEVIYQNYTDSIVFTNSYIESSKWANDTLTNKFSNWPDQICVEISNGCTCKGGQGHDDSLVYSKTNFGWKKENYTADSVMGWAYFYTNEDQLTSIKELSFNRNLLKINNGFLSFKNEEVFRVKIFSILGKLIHATREYDSEYLIPDRQKKYLMLIETKSNNEKMWIQN